MMGGSTTKRRRKRRTGHGTSAIYSLRPAARRHVEVSLEEHLIEQTQPATEVEVTTQTDAFDERPQTPDYVPKKTGIDVATQIEPDGLFSFDREVEPILDIIVGKTLEQALLEVEEETELDAIEKRKQELLDGKEQERQRISRMEEKAMEEYKSMSLLRKRARGAAQAKEQARRKVAATHAGVMLARQAMNAAMSSLHREGGFVDPLKVDVSQKFMPWLMDQVEARMEQYAVADACRDVAVERAVARGAELVAAEKARLAEEERKRQQKLAEERKMYVRVFVKVVVGDGEEVLAGPIRVRRSLTVDEFEQATQQYLQQHGFEVPDGSLNLMYSGSVLDKQRSLLSQALPDEAQLEIGGAEADGDDE